MKSWPGLLLPLALLVGCSRPTVRLAPTNDEPIKPSPAPSTGKTAPRADKKEDAALKKDIARPRENPEVVKNSERGILRGVVKWEGAEPGPPTPRLRIDPETKGVAQTVVWLLSANKAALHPPVEPVRLSVEKGEYQPHILLAQKGSTIELGTTEDRADFQASGAATFSETIERGDRRTFPLSSPGLIEVRSQLQPKRTPAYVWVLDGTPGTLTGVDGQFRLPPVPAGEYELVLWHEDWQQSAAQPHKKQIPISLGPNDGAEVRWTLTPTKK